MAFSIINEENVYLCTGNPLPRDIRQILEDVLNKPMAESYASIFLITAFFWIEIRKKANCA